MMQAWHAAWEPGSQEIPPKTAYVSTGVPIASKHVLSV